ncbi:MAG: mechanosensitive ion channel family protein [Coriobacteriia bacterium]|nr:mechanosensitive ion channel family protein [Coriobacteriia bacterium]
MSPALSTFTTRYGVAILYFASFLLVGILLDQALGAFLRSTLLRRTGRLFSAVVRSLRGIISLSLGLIGVWIAFGRTKAFLKEVSKDLYAKEPAGYLSGLISHWLTVLTILLITIFLARLIGRFISYYTASDGSRIPASSIFTNLVKVVIYIIGVALILSQLGVSLTPIITTLGIGGVAIGLALQPTLGNLFAGIQIVSSHQIEPGDFVRLASGDEGTVEDVTWSNTTIRKITSELIVVPNSVLGQEPVINFSRNNHQHTLVVPGMVVVGTDVLRLERVVREVANEIMASSHYTYKGATPAFRLTATTAGGISFNTILPIISYRSEPVVRSEFLELLVERFAAEHIELARPLLAATSTPAQ